MLTIMNDTGGRKSLNLATTLVLRPLLISLDEVNSIRQHSEFSFGSLEETIDLTHLALNLEPIVQLFDNPHRCTKKRWRMGFPLLLY